MSRTLKGLWIVANEDNSINIVSTISFTRKEAIGKFEENGQFPWREYSRKYGWKCKKVNLIIDPI